MTVGPPSPAPGPRGIPSALPAGASIRASFSLTTARGMFPVWSCSANVRPSSTVTPRASRYPGVIVRRRVPRNLPQPHLEFDSHKNALAPLLTHQGRRIRSRSTRTHSAERRMLSLVDPPCHTARARSPSIAAEPIARIVAVTTRKGDVQRSVQARGLLSFVFNELRASKTGQSVDRRLME